MISPENPKFIQIEIETYLGEPTLRLAIVEKRAKLQLIVSCRETLRKKFRCRSRNGYNHG